MPSTLLSHQALVLPLKLRWPHRFSGLALCIGSMAPDLEFIGRMHDDWVFSHTFAAQFYFTVPLTMALVWLLTAVLIPTVLPFVRQNRFVQWHDLAALNAPQSARQWLVVASSAWLGGVSHWVLDGMTHGNHSGWLVPFWPWLRTLVPHPGGPVPLHDALQVWLTLTLAVAAALMWRAIVRRRLLWRWRGLDPQPAPRRARAEGWRLAMWLGVAALHGAVLGVLIRADAPLKTAAAGFAFGAINFALLAATVFGLVLQARRAGWRLAVWPPFGQPPG